MKPLPEISVQTDGLTAHHNMPCACCLKLHAVYDCDRGVFLPCWECQAKGWETSQATRPLLRLIAWLFQPIKHPRPRF